MAERNCGIRPDEPVCAEVINHPEFADSYPDRVVLMRVDWSASRLFGAAGSTSAKVSRTAKLTWDQTSSRFGFTE